MRENNLEEKAIKRPWQANVLIGLILVGWTLFIGLSFYLSMHYLEKNIITHNLWVYFISSTPVILVGFLISAFLNNLMYNLIFLFVSIFLILNLLKRKKWIVFIISILTVFELILFIIVYFLEVNFIDKNAILFLAVILTKLFILYLIFSCLKCPFYNQKKVEQKS